MSIAPPRFIDDLQSVETLSAPPIHWPSALVGLVLAVTLVVGVTWLASIRRPDARVPVREAPAVSPMAETEPPVVVIPTPIPPPPVRDPAPAAPERLKVANTRGQGVNLRADASERAARIKVLPEGTLLGRGWRGLAARPRAQRGRRLGRLQFRDGRERDALIEWSARRREW
jgi:hypothetical protein